MFWVLRVALGALLMGLTPTCAGFETTPTADGPSPPGWIHFDHVGFESFRLRWAPPKNTGRWRLTGFGILVRQSTTNGDESRTIWVNAEPPYHYRVTDLKPHTRYAVIMKSCVGADGRSSCGAWSNAAAIVTEGVHRDSFNFQSPRPP